MSWEVGGWGVKDGRSWCIVLVGAEGGSAIAFMSISNCNSGSTQLSYSVPPGLAQEAAPLILYRAVITIAAFMSIIDIVKDMKGRLFLNHLIANTISNRWNSMESIKSVTCPILLLHGMLDAMIPYDHSKQLYGNCPSISLNPLSSSKFFLIFISFVFFKSLNGFDSLILPVCLLSYG